MVDPGVSPGEEVSLEEHIRRALRQDAASWSWLVEHYSPLLELQARYRLRGPLRRLYDPEDLVNEVWMVAFRRLPEFQWPATAHGRVLLAFLGTTLVNKINDAIRRHIRRNGVAREFAMRVALNESASVGALTGSTTSVLARAARSEVRQLLTRKLEGLRPDEREILVLRGIEGLSNAALVQRLGQHDSCLSMRYRRALEKLKGVLPHGLLVDLERE